MSKIPNWSKDYENTDGVTLLIWEHDNEKVEQLAGSGEIRTERHVTVTEAGPHYWDVEYSKRRVTDEPRNASGIKVLKEKTRDLGDFDRRTDAVDAARDWMRDHPNP